MTAPTTFPGTAPVPPKTVRTASWLVALAVPLAYLFLYVPVGMDTTDFGYFYGFSWRILEGQFPYRDFFYIKPSLPLFWHAFWMKLTPDGIEVLAGKAGFLCSMLAASWFAAGYLSKIFSFEKLGIPLPLLATAGFIFGIHSFPCMPWHTADGILFAGAGIFFTASAGPSWEASSWPAPLSASSPSCSCPQVPWSLPGSAAAVPNPSACFWAGWARTRSSPSSSGRPEPGPSSRP